MQVKISEGFVRQQIRNAARLGSNSEPIFCFSPKNSIEPPADEKILGQWLLDLTETDFDSVKRMLERLKLFRPTIICGSEDEIVSLARIWKLNADNSRRAAINVAHDTGGAVAMKLDEDKNLVTDGNIIAIIGGSSRDFEKIARYASATTPLIAALIIFDDSNLTLEIAGQ